MRFFLITLAVLFLGGASAYAGESKYRVIEVPAEYLDAKNPHTTAKDLKKGERYYQGKCSECHGEEGEGDEGGDAVAFNDKEWMATRSDGQLFYVISEGAGEDSEMEGYGPEWDAGMSEKKMWQMVTYIRTLVNKEE